MVMMIMVILMTTGHIDDNCYDDGYHTIANMDIDEWSKH